MISLALILTLIIAGIAAHFGVLAWERDPDSAHSKIIIAAGAVCATGVLVALGLLLVNYFH